MYIHYFIRLDTMENEENPDNTSNTDICKNILIGTNPHTIQWLPALNKIRKLDEHIHVCDFYDWQITTDIITDKNINYVLPLSKKDNVLIKKNLTKLARVKKTKTDVRIIYPSEQTIELLDNKNLFTQFMLDNYKENIPEVYYLNGQSVNPIKYPAIYKPMRSHSGLNMVVVHNEHELKKLKDLNNVQKFIEDLYEYSFYALCVDGEIITWKIARFEYEKFNIKKGIFPRDYEFVDNFDIGLFASIVKKLNYSGGLCVDFKYSESESKIYIFEMNPRFGGSAFAFGFICDLIKPLVYT